MTTFFSLCPTGLAVFLIIVTFVHNIYVQPVSYKRYFRCNNRFLLLVYTNNLSLSTDLVDPPPMRTFYMKHALPICKEMTETKWTNNRVIDLHRFPLTKINGVGLLYEERQTRSLLTPNVFKLRRFNCSDKREKVDFFYFCEKWGFPDLVESL